METDGWHSALRSLQERPDVLLPSVLVPKQGVQEVRRPLTDRVESLWDQIKGLDPVELRELHERIRRERGEEEPGASGVREPRRPEPPTDEEGAAVDPLSAYDYETEGRGGT